MYSCELPSMTGNKCLSSDRNIWEYEDPAILPGWKVHSWQDRGNEEKLCWGSENGRLLFNAEENRTFSIKELMLKLRALL